MGKRVPIDLSRLHPRGNLSLKIRDQTGRIRVAAVASVAQMFEQPLQEKQITERERLVPAGRRHVASHAVEGGKDFVRRAFEI